MFVAIYRDVPTIAELDTLEGDTMKPKIAENAQALIDYALSFIPEST